MLSLFQNKQVITAESTNGNLHIKEDNQHLHVYVPRNPRDRELCYLSQLPKRLLNHLGIANVEAITVIQPILHGSVYVLDDILKDNGIVQVPGIEHSQSQTQPEDSETMTYDTREAPLEIDSPNPSLQEQPEYSIVDSTSAASNLSSIQRIPAPHRASRTPDQLRTSSRPSSTSSVDATPRTFLFSG